MKQACDSCSIRKIKCDGCQPCRNCQKLPIECTFLREHGKGGPKRPRNATLNAIRRARVEGSRARRVEQESSVDSTENAGRCFSSSASPPGGEGHDLWMASSGTRGNRIPVSVLKETLEIYNRKMFPVWPVINVPSLIQDLEVAPDDDELYALATSVCGGTMAQLRLPAVLIECTDDTISTEAMGFQAMRARAMFDYREKISINTVLTSMFLYVLNYNQGKRTAGWVHLQEAIIFAKALKLDAEEPLEAQDPEYRRGKLVLWLLFVTESGYANSHNVPMTLRSPRCALPPYYHNGIESESGFRALTTLFAHFDEAAPSSRRDSELTKESLAALQAKLQASVSCSSANYKANQTDLVVTQQWMRTLVWQKSMSLMMLSSAPSDQAMSLSFPTRIVGDLLQFNSILSPEYLKPHGFGMELKLYDIANTLADVILCVPSTSGQSSWQVGPQDFLLRLHGILSSFHQSSPKLYSMLHEKTQRALSNNIPPSIEMIEPREHDQTRSYSSLDDTSTCEDDIGGSTLDEMTALNSQFFFSNASIPSVAASAVIPRFREESSSQSPW